MENQKIFNIANPAQNNAIKHPPAPLMIIAGAGTGKTFTLENRVVYLVTEYSINPENILTITYTEKAAQELKTRVIKQIGQEAHTMFVGTFHSFCFQIMKHYKNDSPPTLIDQSEAIHMLLDRYDEFHPLESDEFAINPKTAVTESFIPFFNRIRDELIDIKNVVLEDIKDQYADNQELFYQLKDLIRIYPIFQKWKKDQNLIDYNDMIRSAYDLLNNDYETLLQIQEKYKHVIIDEFQDNNFALNEVVRLVAGKKMSITVVGDDDQVIYSFRGANSYNINNFENTYGSHPLYKSITLDRNYRSSQSILDVANQSISNNNCRKEKELISNQKENNIKPIRFWGSKLEQIEFIINEINELKQNHNYKDIAILCRTHAQTTQVVETLDKYGIPNQSPKRGLFSIPAVKDLIAWMQVIGKGSFQNIALYRIIKNKYGEEIAHNVFNQYSAKNISSVLDLIREDKTHTQKHAPIKEIIHLIEHFQGIIHKRSAGEIVWELCKKLNILKHKSNRYMFDDHYAILNIGDLLSRAQKFSESIINNKNDHLYAFNTYLEAIMKSGGLPSVSPLISNKNDCITVNTVHGVKGGEFNIVFLPFQRSASFPLNYRSEKKISTPPDSWLHYSSHTELTAQDHHYQEERRLFYVAITRAKELLYILAPIKATSRFIKELPDELMEDRLKHKNNLDINSYSKLKIKYSRLMQDALSSGQYSLIKTISDLLSIIDKHEASESYTIGDSEIELELKKDLESDFMPEVPEQITLSASSLDTYISCPLKFRMSKIDRIPQAASKPELVFGSIIHKVLQRFHEKEKPIDQERIIRLLNEEWKTGKFEYKVREEKFKSQGEEMLVSYYKSIESSPPNVLRTEYEFSFQIDNITIVGTIDRIDKHDDNNISIIDYKTSKTPTSAKSSLQLAVYCLYLEQSNDPLISGIPSSSSLYFLRNDENPLREHTFSGDELRSTKDKIIEVADGIKNKEFDPEKGNHCNWCDYKDLSCPIWED